MERPFAPKALGGEALPPGAEPLQSDDPAVIDGHHLTARLASGGTSIVYLAQDPDGEQVVVKTTRATDQTQARRWLRTEASCARRLPPFCTAALRTDGTDHSPPYLVSEYIVGPSLAQYVEGVGALDAEQLTALAAALGRSIAAVHGAGLIHCDLKPANVLLAANGPRIIDFSIAQEVPVSGRPADLGTVPYSPGWVAPERTNGFPAAPASDVFGWGCLIGYAATGTSPYDGADVSDGRWSAAGETALAALDEPIRSLVEAALAVNPADRPSTGEIASRLGSGQPESAPAERPVLPQRTDRGLAARFNEAPVDAPTAPLSAVQIDDLAEPRGVTPVPAIPAPDETPRRHPGYATEAFTTSAFADDAFADDAFDDRPGLRDDGYADGSLLPFGDSAEPARPDEATPRRIEYSSENPLSRSREEPERKPRRLRAVAMVTAPAALVAVLATVIAIAVTGTKDEPAGPSSAVRPGQGPVDSDAPAPPAAPAPGAPGRRSYGPHRAAADDARDRTTPSASTGHRGHAGHTNPQTPSHPGGSHKPPTRPPSSPPPTHSPTPSPTPTPTSTGNPQTRTDIPG